jgi:phosphoribosylanthranilate isomerase
MIKRRVRLKVAPFHFVPSTIESSARKDNMSLRIKICGITRHPDALAAVEAGADALGFMFYEASSRAVTPEQAGAILRELPPLVARVGVFVNPSAAAVRDAIHAGINALQFHGEEPLDFCLSFRLPVLKAFRIRDEASLQDCRPYAGVAWLLDSHVPGQRGGTGASFNWDLAVQARTMNPWIILAGGLTPDNVVQAVRQVQPWGVDVSSGVESALGKKDPARIRAFIAAARSA